MKTQLITEAELAKWLNISKSTLHKLRGEGELPYRVLASCIRYSTAEIEAWLAERSVNTTDRKEEEAPDTNSESPSTAQIHTNQP